MNAFLSFHKFVAILFSVLPLLFVNAQKATDLQVEHLINPIGIDAVQPRLSWRLHDERKGASQTAYKIVFGTN